MLTIFEVETMLKQGSVKTEACKTGCLLRFGSNQPKRILEETEIVKFQRTKLYYFVRPHLEYAAAVWDPHQQGLINSFEKFALKASTINWDTDYKTLNEICNLATHPEATMAFSEAIHSLSNTQWSYFATSALVYCKET